MAHLIAAAIVEVLLYSGSRWQLPQRFELRPALAMTEAWRRASVIGVKPGFAALCQLITASSQDLLRYASGKPGFSVSVNLFRRSASIRP
jgi:hypothetical protein